ncbi:sensor histidine kinase [Spirosoma endophyticum]|uniref:Histidine kinase n=1 Tax=Spirosoma endophyticum TaxID=662367 RepID=A0A1I2EU48_9BACT|nr:sensor histidine kinase [Spirosoma endophyticum]SFE96339.1 Histidine kinase [Spirosoma endophyticum]
MTPQENPLNIQQLLSRALQAIRRPVAESQRRLLLVVNITYLVLAAEYILTEWFSTGKAVPEQILWYVYVLVGVTNAVSCVYTYVNMSPSKSRKILGFTIAFETTNKFEQRLRWASLIAIMIMSFCFMIGLGNPSNDTLLTDFALGHSLIVLVAMLLGREASFIWFSIVLSILVYTTFIQKGYSSQYNYMTQTESMRYESALAKGEKWALNRQELLKSQHMNSPKASRYFNMWFCFIVVAYLSAYFFTESARKVDDIVPSVEKDMKVAIEEAHRQDMANSLVMQEALNAELKNLKAQINPHFLFNTLNYFYMKSLDYSQELASSILMLSDIMQYSVRENVDRVGLDEEIKHMRHFIELLQLRNNNKLYIDFKVKGPVNQIQILPFLFIGLLENAFKHGNMLNANKPLIITIEATPPHLKFYTCNQKNRKKKVSSTLIGLNNTRRRLNLTYQHYSFDIDQDEESFCINLSVNTHDLIGGFESQTVV